MPEKSSARDGNDDGKETIPAANIPTTNQDTILPCNIAILPGIDDMAII
jgi:hypothetical protein